MLSVAFGRTLHVVNCHATTEISDLIGGLRPVRGRSSLGSELYSILNEFVSLYSESDLIAGLEIPPILAQADCVKDGIDDKGLETLVQFAQSIDSVLQDRKETQDKQTVKRRKLETGQTSPATEEDDSSSTVIEQIQSLCDVTMPCSSGSTVPW